MIKHRAGISAPTDQEIADAFKKIEKIIPANQVATIIQARESIGGLLGFCLAIFEAWQKLDLVISLDTHQKELATTLGALQAAKDSLAESLETAKFDHLQTVTSLSNELYVQRTAAKDERNSLNAEIRELKNQKVALAQDLVDMKAAHDFKMTGLEKAAEKKLAAVTKEITIAKLRLDEAEKSLETLKAKLG